MIDETTQILALLNKKSAVTTFVGTFISATLTGCVVDVGGGRVPARFGTSYLPEVKESVLVIFIDGNPFVMGPAVTKPGQGTVVSSASNLVTLSTDYGQIVVPYSAAITPAAGQVLKVGWQGGGFAHSVMSTSPLAGVAPAGPSTSAQTHIDTFTAIDAGSYGSSWFTGQVYASDSNVGAWFFGSKVADTIPARAVISSVQVYVSAQQISGAAPNFAVHGYGSKPAGAPSFASSTAVAIKPGQVSLPNSFGDLLKAGGGYLGVGLNHGGYSILNSLAADGQSGTLTITSVY